MDIRELVAQTIKLPNEMVYVIRKEDGEYHPFPLKIKTCSVAIGLTNKGYQLDVTLTGTLPSGLLAGYRLQDTYPDMLTCAKEAAKKEAHRKLYDRARFSMDHHHDASEKSYVKRILERCE